MKKSKSVHAKRPKLLRAPEPPDTGLRPDEMILEYLCEPPGVRRGIEKAIVKALRPRGWYDVGSGYSFIDGKRDLQFVFKPKFDFQIEGRRYARFRGEVGEIVNSRNDLADIVISGRTFTVKISSLKFDVWVKTITVNVPHVKRKGSK